MTTTAPVLNRLHAALAAIILAIGLIDTSARGLWFDFGADNSQTQGGPTGEPVSWNNLASEGTDDGGVIFDLVTTKGVPTTISLQMIARFNGANENGTTTHPSYPASATRDSLFGNTEVFSGLENITPRFQLAGLDLAASYTLTFYASRTGVSDNRQTRYTVTGSAQRVVDLDVANNVTNAVQVISISPDALGQLAVEITPGPNNNNANHFVYLGVLAIESSKRGDNPDRRRRWRVDHGHI